jgi:starch synthase
MKITMIASECAPVAKVGGLADVVIGLANDSSRRGNEVEVILPKYDCLRYDLINDLTKLTDDLLIPWYKGAVRCSVWAGMVNGGGKCIFIDPHSNDSFFNRGVIYGFEDDAMRFAFFSKAAIEFLYKSGRRPDIIHSHDWPTGLVAVLLDEIYKPIGMDTPKVCFTIHNFRHQGVAQAEILDAVGLDRRDYFLHWDRLGHFANSNLVNFMKGGIVYSDYITSVSPHYAWEAKNTDQGYGLGPLLNRFEGKFQGILNGLDYAIWNPENDDHIPAKFSSETVREKYRNQKALRERLGLREDYKPILSFIGRLDEQKGIHLIRHALLYSLSHGAQFVLLGTSPDSRITQDFLMLQKRFNENPDCSIELDFDEELSHLIYAGSDLFVVPSMYEPCGLTQMIALRYGTVPVVRAVGGLVNSVFDRDYSEKPMEERNGFTFQHTDNNALESALYRAFDLWYNHPFDFRALMLNGMRYNFSWEVSGEKYQEIYKKIMNQPGSSKQNSE